MTSYNLYESLGLDRTKTPEQLDAELSQRITGVTRETPEFYELDAARSVLGDATKRSMYDQRLDSDAEVTITDIQHLAAMNVHGAGAAAASGSSGVAGAVKSAYAQYPKATIGTGILAALVVVVVVGAIVSTVGGRATDDDSNSAEATGNASAKTTEAQKDKDIADAQQKFKDMNLARAGDIITTSDIRNDDYSGKHLYTNDVTWTYDNPRKTSDDNGAAACFDLTGRFEGEYNPEKINLDPPQKFGEETKVEGLNDWNYTGDEAIELNIEGVIPLIGAVDGVTSVHSDEYTLDKNRTDDTPEIVSSDIDGRDFTATSCVEITGTEETLGGIIIDFPSGMSDAVSEFRIAENSPDADGFYLKF